MTNVVHCPYRMSYEFTNDWFDYQEPQHQEFLPEVIGVDGTVHILEIGSHEGRSTVFFSKYLTKRSTLTCIDPFDISDNTSPVTAETYRRYLSNVEETGKAKQITLMKEYSTTGLANLIANGRQFDYILIDGSHHAPDVMTDACMSYALLRKGGIIFFDDYAPTNADTTSLPHIAIDAFLDSFKNRIELIHKKYHVIVRKL